MWNGCKIIVLFVVISVSQEVEITTSEPSNSIVEVIVPNHHKGLTSNQNIARPSFHPKPGGVLAGSLLLDALNSTTLSSETLITTTEDIKPQTVLEYKPLKPFHQPFPINQLTPPAKPRPESAGGYETVKPSKSPPVQTFPPDLVDRFPELTTLNKRTTNSKVMSSKRQPETSTEDNFVKPVMVLGYKPITSFYHPHPVTIPQLIPTGKPWPASAEGYETTIRPSSGTTLRPELVTSKSTTAKTPSKKKTKLPLLVSRKTTTPKVSTAKQTTISQVVTIKTTTADNLKPATVLEYQPTTTFFRPHPVTPAQIIKPGKPWPASAEGHQSTIASSSASTPSPTLATAEYVEAQTVLEYKPSTSFYHPHPVTIPQLIPPGKPWPASAESGQTTISPSSTSTTKAPTLPTKPTTEYAEAQTVLEYKPSTSFYHPHPVTIPQLIPPGKPWPASAESDQTTISPSSASTTKAPALPTKPTTDYVEAQTVLEYKPSTSFYHPHPVTIPQLIPPGKPWPASAESDETTISPSSASTTKAPALPTKPTTEYVEAQTVLEYKPSTSFYHPHPVTIPQLIPPGKPWPASAESDQTTISPSSASTTMAPALPTKPTTEYVEAQTVLEYKPSTSFYHPHPVTIPQLIPPGKPWPASAESDETTISPSSASTTKASALPSKPTTEYVEAQTVLEYKPSTPFYHPHPVTIPQLIPPGKPWPASANENGTSLNLTNRFPELGGIKTTTTKTTNKKTTIKSTVSSAATPTSASSTRIILTYKPQRPWYHPRPGNTVGQIIPPGKPWPASPSGYPSFSATTLPPWLKESIDKDAGNNEISVPHHKAQELQSLKEEPSLEPNALQYEGPSITAKPTYNIAPTPFTSGTQKTTISDIVDILKEVHNITLVSGNSPPSPSHLLPFDVDKGSQLGSPVVRRPPPKEHQQQNQPPLQVYDGAVSLDGQVNRERIFTNPKFGQAQ